MMMIQMVGAGIAGLVAGGVIGVVGTSFGVAPVIKELEDKLADVRRDQKNWQQHWEKLNNILAVVRCESAKMSVPIRNKNGSIKGYQTVFAALNTHIKAMGKVHQDKTYEL